MRSIGQVVELGTEVRVDPLGDLELAVDHQIGVPHARAAEDVAPAATEGSGGRPRRESGGIEPGCAGSNSVEVGHAGLDLHGRLAIAHGVQGAAVSVYGERGAGVARHYTVD